MLGGKVSKMFCGSCGIRLSKLTNFCEACGNKLSTDLADKNSLKASDIDGETTARPSQHAAESKKNNSGWIFVSMFFLLVVAMAVSLINDGSNTAKSSSTSPSPKTEASIEDSVDTIQPYETESACNFLIPILERSAPYFGNRVSDAKSDETLSELILSVRSAARQFDVEYKGLFDHEGRGEALYLKNFDFQIEQTITLTVAGSNNSLVWAEFVDSMYVSVVEPCSRVGVTFDPKI